MENKLKDKEEYIIELKENQIVVTDKRGNDDLGEDGEGFGEVKYYKGICKKLIMDLYKLK